MHPQLQEIYQATIERYRRDPRIVAAFEFGSLGKGTSDTFSDVDPVFVVEDADFAQVDAELRPLFEGFGYPIALWWPEGFNSDDIRNYAILLEAGELLQYDMTIAKVASVQGGQGRHLLLGGSEVLFDKKGLLQPILDAAAAVPYSPARLTWEIERFWIYVYIHAKYLRRGDLWKLVYGQWTLFQGHLTVLRALHSEDWRWWPWSVKNLLGPEQQRELLIYHGSAEAGAIGEALAREMDLFARDARAACAAWGQAYPAALEERVRAHLAHVLPR